MSGRLASSRRGREKEHDEDEDNDRKESLEERAEKWMRMRRGSWRWEHAPEHRELAAAAALSGRDLSEGVAQDLGALVDAEDKFRRMSRMLSGEALYGLTEHLNAEDMVESVLRLKGELKQKHQRAMSARGDAAKELASPMGLFHLTSTHAAVAPARTKSAPPKFDPSKLQSVQRHKAYREHLQKSIQQAREQEEELSQFRARPLPRYFTFPQRRPSTPKLDVDLSTMLPSSRSEHSKRAPFLQVQTAEPLDVEAAAREKAYYEALEQELIAPGNWHQLPMMERQKRWLLRRELKAEQARVECILSPVPESDLGPAIRSAQESWARAKKMSERSKQRADRDEEERLELKAMRERVKLLKQRAHIEEMRQEARMHLAAVKSMQPKVRRRKRENAVNTNRPIISGPDSPEVQRTVDEQTEDEQQAAPAQQSQGDVPRPQTSNRWLQPPAHLDVLRQVDKLIAKKGWTKELNRFEQKRTSSPLRSSSDPTSQTGTPIAATINSQDVSIDSPSAPSSPLPLPSASPVQTRQQDDNESEKEEKTEDEQEQQSLEKLSENVSPPPPPPLPPPLPEKSVDEGVLATIGSMDQERRTLRTAERKMDPSLAGVLERIHERATTASDIAPYERAERSGVFFDRSSTKEIGRFRVYDAREFDVTTIQRIPDPTTNGVKLLVGERKGVATGSQQSGEQLEQQRRDVITVLFDRRLFDEEAAKLWWQTHKQRLLQFERIST